MQGIICPSLVIPLIMLCVAAPTCAQITRSPAKDAQQLEMLGIGQSESPISAQERQMAESIALTVASTEWLGALAPVALSPFFGLTCLSAISIMGQDFLPAGHFLQRPSPLSNPLVLLALLLLTILTSVPKFSKVSKPFGQAVDQMETYSALIILIVIRFIGSVGISEAPDQIALLYQAGLIEVSLESLLMVATVVNVLVINSVKFFFEMLIWITPFPMIDAAFEAANKATCAGLATVYAFSPTVATLINLAMLAGCLLVFRWVKRRELFYRTILIDFLYSWRDPREPIPSHARLIAFPQAEFHGWPAYSRCELITQRDGWLLQRHRWFRPPEDYPLTEQPSIDRGLLVNSLVIEGISFKFGRRYNRRMSELADRFHLAFSGSDEVSKPTGSLAGELAT